jgi:exosortase
MSSQLAHSTTTSDRAIDVRGPVLGALVVVLLVTWLFWDFFSRQVLWAVRQQSDWGHTLIVPLIAGYFVYLNRKELLARPFKTTWVGFIPILLGVGLYTLSALGPQVLSHHNLRGAGVALTIFGIALLFCGFRAMLWLWFPIAYLCVFGQTISDRFMQIVTFRLQDITARGAHVALLVLGLDVDREGNTLMIVDADGNMKPLNIAEACSGMRMLMAFMALGVAMAYTGLRRFWQRALVVIMGLPTAIFVNILRVVSLGLLSLIDTDFAAGDFHSFVGLVWLVPAFVIYLGVIWVVRHLVTEQPDEEGRAPAAPA